VWKIDEENSAVAYGEILVDKTQIKIISGEMTGGTLSAQNNDKR
jgi:hypothetical protein